MGFNSGFKGLNRHTDETDRFDDKKCIRMKSYLSYNEVTMCADEKKNHFLKKMM